MDAQSSRCKKRECVQIACLPNLPPQLGDACWIAGWGAKAGLAAIRASEVLFQGGINILSHDYCKAHTKSLGSGTNFIEEWLRDDELCCGIPDLNNNGLLDSGVFSCNGYGGGPLICNVGGFATLQGVVTWGNGCDGEGVGHVFADVWHFREWINEHS